MARDPVDYNMQRMELRRFQSRCEAQMGTIQRADSLRAVSRLANMPVPFPLTESTDAIDARNEVRRYAEERARELINEFLERLSKVEPMMREKIRRMIDEEFLQLTGPLTNLRVWAHGRLAAVENTFS